MENKFNEDVKGNTAFSNPYDDSNWDGDVKYSNMGYISIIAWKERGKK